jgi:cold shock CspA family protein
MLSCTFLPFSSQACRVYENDKVTYDVEKGRDGKEPAVNLTLL